MLVLNICLHLRGVVCERFSKLEMRIRSVSGRTRQGICSSPEFLFLTKPFDLPMGFLLCFDS